MPTLDIAFFPHIFDLIYESADFRALLLLRLTCRALRKRIDDDWGHLQWTITAEETTEVVNKRGGLVPCDSPCLRLTFAIDHVDDSELETGGAFPAHLRPEIVRFVEPSVTSLTEHAGTIIFLDPEYELDAIESIEYFPPAWEEFNVIYRLDFGRFDRGGPYFSDICRIARRLGGADVFFLLAGCSPVGGAVEALCRSILDSLVGVEREEWQSDVHYYFVDVASWFDLARTSLPSHDPRRLDQALTRPGTFYRYLLSDLGYAEPASDDSEASYDPWVAECVRQHIHNISREQMRQRVGDRAYDLTFAPADIFPR